MRFFYIIIFLSLVIFAKGQNIHYAAPVPSGLNDGSSWANATYFNQTLIDAAQAGDQIWVKWGSYIPSGFLREISFNLKNGVRIYGGFAGIESNISERNLDSPLKSVLSGDIGVALNQSDNSYHVINSTNCDSTTILDGFVITSGNANGAEENQNKGGGLVMIYTDPNIYKALTIRNCTFINCKASYGGGIAISSNNGNLPALNIENTIFESNVSGSGGGGIFSDGGLFDGIATNLNNCAFYSNRAKTGLGGGINFYNTSGKYNLNNCLFFRDSTGMGFEGGGVYFGVTEKDCEINLNNCKFDQCVAAVGGGLYIADYYNSSKNINLNVTKTAFSKNQVNNEGGGMAVFGGSGSVLNILMDSVAFDGNLANSDAAGLNITNSGQCILNLTVKNSRFTNNDGGSPGGGAIRLFHYVGVNSKSNVLIYNCLFFNNTGAYSATIPQPPYKASCTTDIINSTFVNNSLYVFNKNWSQDFDYLNSYNFTNIYNCVIIDTTQLKRIFYNNNFNSFSIYDYRVNHCLLSKPDCIFDGYSICGDQMLYDLDPEFEANSFIPMRCSPLVNGGNNFWPDSFNISNDLLGADRILFDTVDIGAYEVSQACISAISSEPENEQYPVFKLLKNPVARNEPLIFIADHAVYSEVSVQIFDMTGGFRAKRFYSAGDHGVLSMETNLNAGAYVAVISIGSKKYALRFIVTNP